MPATTTPPAPKGTVPPETHIEILLEEYRQLYDLVRFRLNALDQRVPLAGVTLIAAVAGIGSLAAPAQYVFLLAVPLSLLWWLGMTTTHARSFEDALRRIEQIEQRVNALCGVDLLIFQSSHPGRRHVGGRTGQRTVQAVLTACAIILGACAALGAHAFTDCYWLAGYVTGLLGVGVAMLWLTVSLRRYTYERPATTPKQ
jgi:hypothetical protein